LLIVIGVSKASICEGEIAPGWTGGAFIAASRAKALLFAPREWLGSKMFSKLALTIRVWVIQNRVLELWQSTTEIEFAK
jgi:hypothetical protein